MKILLDDSLRTRPVGTAIAYTWAAMSASWKNTSIVAALLLLLALLEFVPLIGWFASIFQGILLYAIAYWIVDRLRGSAAVENFKTAVAQGDLKETLFAFFSPAAGYYTGFVLFSVIMMILSTLIFWLSGGFEAFALIEQQQTIQNPTPEQTYEMYMQVLGLSTPTLLFFLITSLFFSYLWPLVYGYALLQRSFTDAFNAVFMFFSTAFWKAAFTGSYFKTVSLWMLVSLGVGLLMGFCLMTFVLLPVAVLLILWLVYFTAIVSVSTYNMSDDI
ncbi:hypothetical protein [Hydrogenimonas cancrithermarum]|uniref:Integral membrane protein n=1 Tax=Hydrogenimonas cancrithermarum TaxID=2993563 RepID=A0ABN6WWF0_9BACT|nr:hypothetical protein [Hydrogenimonas cancrithermarum]BDY13479.1 hypothetical protein HCR_17910 [Hydrogenimonas cancrithermarum]